MILLHATLQKILTENVKQQERFATSSDTCDNLYHPIAIGRNELLKI